MVNQYEINKDVIAHKFSSSAKEKKPEFNDEKVDTFLKSKYQKGTVFGRENLQREGVYKEAGWSYNFRPYMNKYLVKQGGQWGEVYAPNKSALRNSTYGKIEDIKELKKGEKVN